MGQVFEGGDTIFRTDPDRQTEERKQVLKAKYTRKKNMDQHAGKISNSETNKQGGRGFALLSSDKTRGTEKDGTRKASDSPKRMQLETSSKEESRKVGREKKSTARDKHRLTQRGMEDDQINLTSSRLGKVNMHEENSRTSAKKSVERKLKRARKREV